MFGRKIIFAAAAMYVAALGCGLVKSGDSTTQPASMPGLVHVANQRPFCGAAIQIQRVDWIDKYEQTIDEIANDGGDTVSLVVDARVENGDSTQIYLDMRKTPTQGQLTELIKHAKSKNLRVILMPIVLPDAPTHDEWRGTLKPYDWHKWFESYRDMMRFYSYIAQDTGVDVLVVGSELVSSEEHKDEWIETIKTVREIYHGQLTYSSNWDRYWKVEFWDYLDFVGMNSYWDIGGYKDVDKDRDITISHIKDTWSHIQKEMFVDHKITKPVILLEAGWCSLANAATASWDYTQDQYDADNDLQRRLYEGFFQSWWGDPRLAGMIMWEFRPGGDDATGDAAGKGYTPQAKPAEQVMRQWFAKPRWQISQ